MSVEPRGFAAVTVACVTLLAGCLLPQETVSGPDVGPDTPQWVHESETFEISDHVECAVSVNLVNTKDACQSIVRDEPIDDIEIPFQKNRLHRITLTIESDDPAFATTGSEFCIRADIREVDLPDGRHCEADGTAVFWQAEDDQVLDGPRDPTLRLDVRLDRDGGAVIDQEWFVTVTLDYRWQA